MNDGVDSIPVALRRTHRKFPAKERMKILGELI